jgi:putative ubiquitin-RnfH superfamily antitoxin RatB of RatAB toxin-antitoxin module
MSEPGDAQLEVEVAYALPNQQRIVRVNVSNGARVVDAIHASRLLSEFPEIDLAVNAVGVWGKAVALEQVLRARDRVEIYRPLAVDPMQARLFRAQHATRQIRAKRKRP